MTTDPGDLCPDWTAFRYTERGAGCAEVRLGVQLGETAGGPGARAGLQVCGLAPGATGAGWLMEGFLGAVLGLGGPHPQGMGKCPW